MYKARSPPDGFWLNCILVSVTRILQETLNLVNTEDKYRIFLMKTFVCFVGRNSDSLRNGRSVDRIPVAARFSAPAQTRPEAHQTPCTMVTKSLSRGKGDQGVALTNHPI